MAVLLLTLMLQPEKDLLIQPLEYPQLLKEKSNKDNYNKTNLNINSTFEIPS